MRVARGFFGATPQTRQAYQCWDPRALGHFDRSVIDQQLAGLHALADPVGRYVNNKLAHLNANGTNVTATYKDLDAALDQMKDLLERYHNLINTGMLNLQLVTPDWRALFRALPLNT